MGIKASANCLKVPMCVERWYVVGNCECRWRSAGLTLNLFNSAVNSAPRSSTYFRIVRFSSSKWASRFVMRVFNSSRRMSVCTFRFSKLSWTVVFNCVSWSSNHWKKKWNDKIDKQTMQLCSQFVSTCSFPYVVWFQLWVQNLIVTFHFLILWF